MNNSKVSSSRGMVAVTVALCALLAGATAWSLAQSHSLSQKLQATEAKLQESNQGHQKDSVTEVAALRKRLEQTDAAYLQLEDAYRLLARQTQERKDGTAAQAIPVSPSVSTNSQSRGANRSSWMERLQREDPERYKQMVAAREQRRQQAQQWYQDQIDQLDQRAQSAPSQDEAELATQIADTLDKINQLRDSWRAVRDLPDDQRQAQAEQLATQTRQAYQTLNDLRDRDRTRQLQILAMQLGLQGQNAQTLVDGVPQIYENTQYTPQRGDGGRGEWGGGPPPGNTGSSGSMQSSTTR
jgi:hypothetical protein